MSVMKDALHMAHQEAEDMLKNCDDKDILVRAELSLMLWNMKRMIDIANLFSKIRNRIK